MDFYMVIFIINTFFVAVSLGLICTKRAILGSSSANFFFGVALCPFVQFLWCFFISFSVGRFFSINRYVFVWGLPLAVFVLLCFTIRLSELRDMILGIQFPKRIIDFVLILLFLGGIIGWFYVGWEELCSAEVIKYDNLEYFGKASYFAEHRTWDSISYLRGIPNGSASADSHFPSYILYLGYAFMHTTAEHIEYPYHWVALYAVFILPVYIMSAAMALYCNLKNKFKFSLLSPIMMGSISFLLYQLYSSTRDLFKVTACLVYVTVVVELCKKEERKANISKYVLAFCGAFILMSSHIINILVLISGLGSLFIVFLMDGIKDRKRIYLNINYIKILLFMLIGGLIPFLGNVFCYVSRGTWYSISINFSDYDFYDSMMKYRSYETPEVSIVEKLQKELYMDSYKTGILIIVFAVLICLFYIISGILSNKNGRNSQFTELRLEFLLSIFIIILFVPMTGILDSDYFYNFSDGFIKVPRYVLNYHVIGVVFIFSALSKVVTFSGDIISQNSIKRICIMVSRLCLILFLLYDFYLFGSNVLVYKSDNRSTGNQFFEDRYGEIIDLCSGVGEGERILTIGNWRYVFGDRTLVYNHLSAQPLYENSQEDMEQVFDDLKIRAVVLVGESADSEVSVFPWYGYVSTFEKIEVSSLENFDVYLLTSK